MNIRFAPGQIRFRIDRLELETLLGGRALVMRVDLPGQHAFDGVAHPLVGRHIDRQRFAGRQTVDVKQRHGAADNLLRTSVRITVQRLQQRRHIHGAQG